MDVDFFLNERLKFIRQLYETTSAPYIERKRKIETYEEPYTTYATPDGDYGEPPFLDEWIEADESLHVLAYSCISLLAAALRLYLKTWVEQSRYPVDDSLKKEFKKNGWFSGYKSHFFQRFGIQFDLAPVKHTLLEEVVLARNRIEHPSSIENLRPQYLRSDLKKLQDPYFVDSTYFSNADKYKEFWIFPPTLHVTNDQLLKGISEVENFSAWFEVEIKKKISSR
jgi:hypothetical protein